MTTVADRNTLLLIEPPFYRLFKNSYSLVKFPLALGYLSAVALERTGWAVQAYNADFSVDTRTEHFENAFLAGPGFENYLAALDAPEAPIWGEVASVIGDVRPRVVGISAKSQNFASARIVAHLAKAADPTTIVIVGGPHPSMAGEATLDCPDIDLAVFGEGEETLVELLRAIEAGQTDLSGIKGIIHRHRGKAVRTPARPYIEDLDTLPHPHAHVAEVLRDFDRYPRHAFGYVFATRGCPYNCQFCGSRDIWSRKVRFRSAGDVVDEIKALRAMGVPSVRFDDDTFGLSRTYIGELCSRIRAECPGLKWSCEIVVPLVNRENISTMVEAGCTKVQIGVESGNDRILREIRKSTTVRAALDAATLLKEYGIEVETFFMAGHFGDTVETLGDTLEAMRSIDSDLIIFNVFTPYPGNEIFDACVKDGLIEGDYDVARYNHQSPENCFARNVDKTTFKAIVTRMAREVDSINARRRRQRQRRYYRRRFIEDIRHNPLSAFAKASRFLVNRWG